MKFVLNKDFLSYESEVLLNYLKSYNWFKKYNYKPTYPNEACFNNLMMKASKNHINDDDISEIKEQLLKITTNEDYSNIYKNNEDVILLANEVLDKTKNIFIEMNKSFGFKIFDTYKVNITKYCPGGSYDPKEGNILIKLRNNRINLSTLLHEMFHIGIEEFIIQHFNINHLTK